MCSANTANGAEWRHPNQLNLQLRNTIISLVSVSVSVLNFLRIIVYLHQLTNIRKIAIQSGSLSVSANQFASQPALRSRFSNTIWKQNTDYKLQTNAKHEWYLPNTHTFDPCNNSSIIIIFNNDVIHILIRTFFFSLRFNSVFLSVLFI